MVAVNVFPLLLFFLLSRSASGFFITTYDGVTTHLSRPVSSVELRLVKEDDVIAKVEKAEKLWADALEARKTANALSDRAEEEAEAASVAAKDADKNMQEGSISIEKLQAADEAARANLDAGSFVDKALTANEEAERLENLAEEALKESELALEQHLIDFPDSPLAE